MCLRGEFGFRRFCITRIDRFSSSKNRQNCCRIIRAVQSTVIEKCWYFNSIYLWITFVASLEKKNSLFNVWYRFKIRIFIIIYCVYVYVYPCVYVLHPFYDESVGTCKIILNSGCLYFTSRIVFALKINNFPTPLKIINSFYITLIALIELYISYCTVRTVFEKIHFEFSST